MANYLEHVQYVCPDLEAMVKFYGFVFDWPLRGRGKEVTPDRTYDWVHLGTDDAYVAFRTPYDGAAYSPEMGYQQNHIGIVVDDFETVLMRLEELGCPYAIKSPHPHRSRAYFRDPNDYEIEIVYYHSSDPSERNDYQIDAEKGRK